MDKIKIGYVIRDNPEHAQVTLKKNKDAIFAAVDWCDANAAAMKTNAGKIFFFKIAVE